MRSTRESNPRKPLTLVLLSKALNLVFLIVTPEIVKWLTIFKINVGVIKMCDNKIEYLIERDNYTVYSRDVRCGTTDPHGERAMCDTCYEDVSIREEAQRQKANSDADNAWLSSAGWGEM